MGGGREAALMHLEHVGRLNPLNKRECGAMRVPRFFLPPHKRLGP